MRGDRLLSILLSLQSYGKMTTSALAEQLEVSERTIHRDMEALSVAGVPVYAERGNTGGWRLAEGYRTNLTGLHKDELQSLLLAHPSQVLSDLGLHKDYENAWTKLLASVPAAIRSDAEIVRERIHIDGVSWHATHESNDWLPIIQDAVWEAHQLRIHYPSSGVSSDQGERIIEPLGLVAKGSVWYVVARHNLQYRTYRISRIQHLERTGQSFIRPDSFQLQSYWEQSMKQFKESLPRYEALLRIHVSILNTLQHARYASILSRMADEQDPEWMILRIQFDTLESACSYLLSYGPHAVVLEPQELRTNVIEQAASLLKLYQVKS
ncbi:transcriptional regulator [Paenibacillus selenitireducens]|uniref:Transcriptional regulator n=1 Tax=Paenibacillus selenitireducens TaxID=1324314 RepID=A0A1T2X1Y3_9BACL|nr:YafY family protein [Paenibacillus selenitireducens]OPA73880.1 transcriptional regulator [Paenibacillus selenitireducens]